MEEKKEKEESLTKQLYHFAGSYKYLSILSTILAAISAFVALVPFYYIWKVMQEVLRVRFDFSKAAGISTYGWRAVGFAILGMIIYMAGLMCSHIAAFHVQAQMRTAMMNHIMTLPLGYIESEGTGKIRKIVTDSSAATETYLAHTLPDKAVSKATPIGLIILMAVFDWRLGIMCLIPAAIGFVFMSSMSGKDLAESMKQYQNSLEVMSAEAVEYIRGVPVVKTFGQTVFSFKRFKEAIDEYEKWTLGFSILIFIVAIKSIESEIIDAAMLDGVNPLQCFWYIKLPIIKSSLLICGILTIYNSFRCFREAYLIGGSHPNEQLYSIQHFLQNNFMNMNYARLEAASILVVIFVGAFILSGMCLARKKRNN